MRNSEMFNASLLLPTLLLGLSAAPIAAQEAAPEAPPAPAAPSGALSERMVTGDRTIGVGDVVEDIIVVGGDLRIRGEVRGDAVVVGGDLILEDGALITGDALVTGGEFVNQGGRVRGEMRTENGVGIDLDRALERAGAGAPATIDEDSDRELSAVRRQEQREEREHFWSSPIRRGFAGIISTLALGLVLAGIGATLVFYGRPYLETVSDTLRSSTLRSAGTGLAASFLAVPAFVVLLVALVVSIVGIPFLLVAIPLYPLALFAGAVFGILATAHAIGERTAEQNRDGMEFRYRNSYAYLFTGLGMVLTPLLAAHLIGMTGFLGFIGTILKVLTCLVIWVATTVGFGAVILSRAGTRRTFVTPSSSSGLYNDDLFGDDLMTDETNA